MKIRTFGKEYVYYLEDEQALPVEKRTKFVYKTPTLATIIAGQDTTSIETDGKSLEEIRTTMKVELDKTAKFEMVRNCLVRIENLTDDNGDVLWPTDKVGQDKVLSCLDPWIPELAAIFEKAIVITEDEAKNSK